eukprot:g22924.t1
MASYAEGFRAPEVLAAGLDLAVVYLKNYSLDKADTLYSAMEAHCMSRGLPWDVKFMQDLATLRCKQNRQAEAAKLLEGVAERTPPHEATLRNLGTVYNMLRDHDKAKIYFNAASQLVGEVEKEETTGNYSFALAAFQAYDPEDDVTIAKLRDSVGMCYDGMGRYEDAIVHLAEARSLYERSIGTESPLYGTACERLARALVHAGRHQEGFEAAVDAFMVIALQDAVHPTPLFELLGLMTLGSEFGIEAAGENLSRLAKLQVPIAAAVRNLHFREMDRDGNAGVLYERMARAMVLCSMAQGDPAERQAAAHRRAMARALLTQAAPLVADATEQGLADLTHISMLINMQLQTLDAQDAEQRRALGSTGTSMLSGSQKTSDDTRGVRKQRTDRTPQAPGVREAASGAPKLCTICHFEAQRPEVSALCGHFACKACWRDWLREKLECPICRAKVREQNLIELKGWENSCAAACLVWFSFLYANWPVVLSDDAHVCPDGSTLGAIETCINYTSIEGGPSAYGACFAGNIKFPCGCVDGFTPYTTKFYLWSDYVHFRCCSGGDGTSAQCGDLAHKDVTGGVLLGAGLVGFSVCTYFLRSSSTRIPLLTADDKFVENPRSQLDGPKLHQMVEMQKWGVTKDDLHQFRRLVMNAILEQRILPTERDPATAAYVCFLSNPQNLDIGELIASPQDSPFAKCLRNSRQMLVIPNAKGSIYTRIWCVYEAFLAYSWGKPIKTARAPVPHYWLQLLRV